jgi:hypothetical protein
MYFGLSLFRNYYCTPSPLLPRIIEITLYHRMWTPCKNTDFVVIHCRTLLTAFGARKVERAVFIMTHCTSLCTQWSWCTDIRSGEGGNSNTDSILIISIWNKLANQMRQFYKFITWHCVSLNMFRAPPRPSSGAYNCINSLWFYPGAWW